ncbi:hypothetical protein BGX29_001817, partial [Mortierella sp. GBA35]
MSSGREVKYSDADILIKIFPELFPYQVGTFQLRHSSVNLRGQDLDDDEPVDGLDENDGSFSIKMYAKYRLLHFDRSFAKNARFVVYVHNWIRKAVVHGYRMRSTTSTRQATATTASHVLQGGCFSIEDSVVIPESVRTSIAYKQQFRSDVQTQFDALGTPEIFGT